MLEPTKKYCPTCFSVGYIQTEDGCLCNNCGFDGTLDNLKDPYKTKKIDPPKLVEIQVEE